MNVVNFTSMVVQNLQKTKVNTVFSALSRTYLPHRIFVQCPNHLRHSYEQDYVKRIYVNDQLDKRLAYEISTRFYFSITNQNNWPTSYCRNWEVYIFLCCSDLSGKLELNATAHNPQKCSKFSLLIRECQISTKIWMLVTKLSKFSDTSVNTGQQY